MTLKNFKVQKSENYENCVILGFGLFAMFLRWKVLQFIGCKFQTSDLKQSLLNKIELVYTIVLV